MRGNSLNYFFVVEQLAIKHLNWSHSTLVQESNLKYFHWLQVFSIRLKWKFHRISSEILRHLRRKCHSRISDDLSIRVEIFLLNRQRGENNKIVQMQSVAKENRSARPFTRCSHQNKFSIFELEIAIFQFVKRLQKSLLRVERLHRRNFHREVSLFFSRLFPGLAPSCRSLTVRPQVACMTAMSCSCALFFNREGFFHYNSFLVIEEL